MDFRPPPRRAKWNRPRSPTGRGSRLKTGPARVRSPPGVPLVPEEALAGLAPELAVRDQPLQDPRRVIALALPVPILHRAVEDVEAAEVEQVERAHRPVEALLHRDVDVLRAGVTAFQQA